MEQLRRFVVNMDEKLDSIKDDLTEIKVVQKSQAKDLEYHIRRTDLLEEKVGLIKAEIRPNTVFRTKAEQTFKVIGVIGSGLALVFSGIKALEWVSKILEKLG